MNPLTVIAEAAQGYGGRPLLAELLVRAAAAARADAVKFQIVFADDVAVPGYRYYEWYKQVEMPLDAWRGIRELARTSGLKFYSDISGERALAIATQLSLDAVKIHAGNFFNHRLVEQIFASFPYVLVSTGGISLEEVQRFIERHRLAPGSGRAAFLYGFQAEPTPLEANQLARLSEWIRRLDGFDVGFMDHTDGGSEDVAAVSLMAQALGVRMFERHLTLDRELRLEDYTSALAPTQFAEYAATLRRLDPALGSGDVTLTDAERSYRERMLKKLIAVDGLQAGHVIRDADLLQRRLEVEGDGFCHDPDHVIGRRLARGVDAGQPLRLADLES